MNRNTGYVSGIEYEAAFFREQSPVHLNLVCLAGGRRPVVLEPGFTYCELGCGPGFTAAVLAAANPQGRFYAFDFNPAHVAEGRELARQAGLDNLILREDSFAELAAGAVDLPQFDFVTMYGVFTWVNDENRRHIVDFLARYLKPGGIVYVNYNALPGWADTHPLQRLILDVSGAASGTSAERCEQARAAVGQLESVHARYLTEHAGPRLQQALDSIRNDKPAYLAHEYMNEGWRPLYHADVARQLGAAGLDYVADAELFKLFPQLYMTPARQAALARTPEALRETARDFLVHNAFRQDIYVRAARHLDAVGQGEWMARLGLALTLPRALVKTRAALPHGGRIERDELYVPVFDALAEAPRSLAELKALPALRGATMEAFFEMIAVLLAGRQVAACSMDGTLDSAPAQRLNRAIAASSHYQPAYHAFASPVLGSGMRGSVAARVAYRGLNELGTDVDPVVLTERVWRLMDGEGRPRGWTGGGAADAIEREQVAQRMPVVLEHLVPLWRQLKMF